MRNHKSYKVEGLRPWSQIKGLENVSGIGSYKTSFIIASYQTEYMGAYLDLGMLSDTFMVNINDFALPMTDLKSAFTGKLFQPVNALFV